jgi:hypothetical protein
MEDAPAMDAARFDDLARTLFASASRRALLSLGAAGGLSGLHARWDAVSAKKKHKKKKRKVCRKCKHGKCKKPKPDGTPCGETCHACQNGHCVVAAGASCGDSQTCLLNATCAIVCGIGSPCPGAPGVCACFPNSEGINNCFDSTDPAYACIGDLRECVSSADCPLNTACMQTPCDGGLKICLALCSV